MKKRNKYLIGLGATVATFAPIASIVACDSSKDELDFQAVNKDEFVFTNTKVHDTIVPIIADIEKFLNSELSKNYPVAEDDYDNVIKKLAFFESDNQSVVPKAKEFIDSVNKRISDFGSGIEGTNFNIANRTYQKMMDYQAKLPTIIKNTASGIWAFIYNNLVQKALMDQLVYSSLDNQVPNKADVKAANLYWVDSTAVEKLFDDIDAARAKANKPPLDKPAAGTQRTWNDIIKAITSNAANNPMDEDDVQPSAKDQVEWIENWLNKNLVVWDGKNAVAGSIHIHVERGNVASQIDVAKAKALVLPNQKNIVYDLPEQIMIGDKSYLIDETHFQLNDVYITVPQAYKDYLQNKYNDNSLSDCAVKDADDWYKLVDEVSKDPKEGKQNLDIIKTGLATYQKLSDLGKLVYMKVISYINASTKVLFTTLKEDPNAANTLLIQPETGFVDGTNVSIDDMVNSISVNVKTNLFDELKPTSGTWVKTNQNSSADSDAVKLTTTNGILQKIIDKYGSWGLLFILDNVYFPAAEKNWTNANLTSKFTNIQTALDDGFILKKSDSGNDKYQWTEDTNVEKSKVVFADDKISADKIRDWQGGLQSF